MGLTSSTKYYNIMRKLTLPLAIALTIGCIAPVSAQRTVERETERTTAQARNVEPKSSVIVAPQVAELTVDSTRVIKTYRYTHNGSVNLANARALAVADFQKDNSADVIIGALIDTRQTADAIEVTVQGYPATYSHIRPATADDQWMLYFINSETIGKNTEAIRK